MKESRWQEARALFAEALELPEAERLAFVEIRAKGDPELRSEVTSLLESHAGAGSFLAGTEVGVLQRLEDPDLPEIVRERIGPWRVVRLLGEGGMGRVYLGERATGDYEQQVAIKVVSGGLESAEIVRRFHTERRILAALEHPGIARLLDGGRTEDGLPYFVMEYVDGSGILAFADRRCLDLGARIGLFLEVCAAVEHAHQRLIVHRDIKPSNILIGADSRPKLLDFGIGKLLESGEGEAAASPTATRGRFMTVAYASPEQILGQETTTATDVYGLGGVLYELLTGCRPYRGEGAGSRQIEDAILHGTLRRASTVVGSAKLRRSLRGDLDNVLAKALARRPAERYVSVAAFAEDLKRFLEGRPVRAREAGLAYRGAKFMARHRWAVAGTAAAIAALATLSAIYTIRLRDERNHAQVEAAKAQEVTAYLIGLFGEAGMTPNVPSVKELLERGEAGVSQLAGQDEVQEALWLALGTAYRHLGSFERAVGAFDRALANASRQHGAEAPEVAAVLVEKGKAQREFGRLPEARATLERALEIRRRSGGEASPEYAQVLDAVAGVDWGEARYDAALAGVERAVEIYAGSRPDDVEADRMRGNLGEALLARGDLRRAGEVYRSMLEHAERLGGPDGPNVVYAILGLGEIDLREGHPARAVPRFERAVAMMIRRYGEIHPRTAVAQLALGRALGANGERKRGAALIEKAVGTREQLFGTDNPETRSARAELARLRATADPSPARSPL